jgi:3-deoxy-manno-octulosonate cytidylyltransferase (CMP-KDO synthetase)
MMKKLLEMPPLPFYVVIPARYASTRLPGKPLLDIAGKPMVVWVAERAKQSGAKDVIVATDDQRIMDVVSAYGHQAVMTQSHHVTGTDRVAEVVEKLGWTDDAIVVNVQGDEPLISPMVIAEVAEKLAADGDAVMSTACYPVMSKNDFLNPNVVKVVLNNAQQALYFSRAPIPYPRDDFSRLTDDLVASMAYRHIGIYAYRISFLKKYANLQQSTLESVESLEQLRVLSQGFKIAVSVLSDLPAAGVDTAEDLEQVRKMTHLFNDLKV